MRVLHSINREPLKTAIYRQAEAAVARWGFIAFKGSLQRKWTERVACQNGYKMPMIRVVVGGHPDKAAAEAAGAY